MKSLKQPNMKKLILLLGLLLYVCYANAQTNKNTSNRKSTSSISETNKQKQSVRSRGPSHSSVTPYVSINPIPDICSGTDTSYLTIGQNPESIIVIQPMSAMLKASKTLDSVTFIPDGNLCSVQCYYTALTFTDFDTAAIITSVSDILSVCVNMEHSFAGDLGFTVICPNGQSVVLDPNTHSGGAFLGVPLDNAPYDSQTYPCDEAYNTIGPAGWTYCWSEIYPQHGTFDFLSSNSDDTMDSTNTITDSNYITPTNSFSSLIGCPLNGVWHIKICDDYTSDNGYLFWWQLNFDPTLLPNGGVINYPVDTIIWTGDFLNVINDSTVMVTPETGGNLSYSVSVIDTAGTIYDTSFYLYVVDTPNLNLGPDTTFCSNYINMLDAGFADIYHWSTGNHSQSQEVTSSGNYYVTVGNHNVDYSLTCWSTDSVYITLMSCDGIEDISPQDTYCKVYPNPAFDIISIIIPEKAVIEILNMEGQTLKTLSTENELTDVDISNLPCGMYMIEIKTGNGVMVRKFVKE